MVEEEYEGWRSRMAGYSDPKSNTKTKPDNLAVAVKMWPTPSANEDAAGTPQGNMQKMLGNHPDVRAQGSGTLNPTWVEWLMGFPSGFTDLED
jgi:DNA (cytosine-5)-methyltransferase 1